MKKIIAVIFCTFTIFNTIAQISFMPSFDFFSLTTFKDEKPYIKPSFESSVNFNLQAFSEAYFDINFNFFMTEPLNVFNPDKKKRIPIKTFFLNSALTFPSIQNQNIYIALFYGDYDYLNSDKILRETAKVKMESSDFQQYFPTSVFRPDLKVDGLGATIYGSLNKIPVFFAGYTYWNGNYTNEGYTISIDFRTGYIFPNGAINTFVGTKIGNNIKSSELRAGVSGAFDVDGDYEFYFDVGVDKLKFPDKEIHKKFYALFEPRVLYDKFSFSIPFFIAPVSSLPKFMEDSQYTDSSFAGMGLKLTGGNLEKYNFEGGVSLCTSVNPQNISELTAFTLSASPFIKCAISNYILDFRVNVYPFVYEDPKSMVNLTLQIKAAR